MIIERIIENTLLQKLQPGKVILLLGPRRVGKTFLLNKVITKFSEKKIFWNGEDLSVHDLLKKRSVQNYKNIIGNSEIIFIDEAQKIPEIGLILKLIIDSFPNIKIVATGSSAFDIKNSTGEPLTGRKRDLFLFPLSEKELVEYEKVEQRADNLKERLIYGSMPEIIYGKSKNEKQEYLRELMNSYLLKDILIYENVKNSAKIFDLLRMIAFQIGNEVSLNELSKKLAISKNTVERYLDLLEKVFIVFRIRGFSKNLRKEIVKSSKWYFIDNGIRNAVISNFNSLTFRDDVGALWENYMISERIKYQSYNNIFSNNYFWRTYDQQEIDFIEEREGNLFAYEFKWKPQNLKIPKAWAKAYPESQFNIITSENYFEWVA